MTTSEIAKKLKAYCEAADFEGAQRELYAQDAVSIEPYATPAFEKETKGLPAILEKGKKFEDMTEKQGKVEISEPIISGNSFAFILKMDITMKNQGQMNMSEICVYTVKDGKIISEQFFV